MFQIFFFEAILVSVLASVVQSGNYGQHHHGAVSQGGTQHITQQLPLFNGGHNVGQVSGSYNGGQQGSQYTGPQIGGHGDFQVTGLSAKQPVGYTGGQHAETAGIQLGIHSGTQNVGHGGIQTREYSGNVQSVSGAAVQSLGVHGGGYSGKQQQGAYSGRDNSVTKFVRKYKCI